MKDSNNISGQGRKPVPFYEELDAVLGTRAASTPPVVLDSGERNDDCDRSDESA